MNTTQLLQVSAEELTSILLETKSKECERHARNVLKILDGPTYEEVMKSIVNKLIPKDGDEKDHLLRFHDVIAKQFPTISENDETLGRLTYIIYMIVHKNTGTIVDNLAKSNEFHH